MELQDIQYNMLEKLFANLSIQDEADRRQRQKGFQRFVEANLQTWQPPVAATNTRKNKPNENVIRYQGSQKTAQNQNAIKASLSKKTYPEYTKLVVKQNLLGLYKNTNINNFVKRMQLSKYSTEFNDIRANFPPSLTILQIQKVVNPFTRKSFELTRQLKYGNIEPLQLYHGTKMKNLSSICRNNFDWRLSGSETGHRIGHGVNFTSKAKFAVNFCDKSFEKVMILAEVLVRREILGNQDLSVPPDGFDTAVRVKPKHKCYVKFNDSEFYPAYIIYFY
ncbi:protein mono-ADP-ribosyltransferase PARP11-like [Sitophilus oryzae]|uniref:Poly [ADP-ribose] polymerase n=1 Tax=Sitophilus oryzae TaxID=7048 RepID=A0A6J2Y1W4_SITOR|nr:protein mono-ADP-ribosyltransferase PARP11-like [Sitophilus oryzae]